MSAQQAADHVQVVVETAETIGRKQTVVALSDFVTFLRGRGGADAAETLATKVGAAPIPVTFSTDWPARLAATGTNRDAFNAAVGALADDASIKLQQLNDIVARYTGSTKKAKSRKEAVERIRDHFEIDAQYAAKAATIDRLTEGRR